jgi:hypothetical protein
VLEGEPAPPLHAASHDKLASMTVCAAWHRIRAILLLPCMSCPILLRTLMQMRFPMFVQHFSGEFMAKC